MLSFLGNIYAQDLKHTRLELRDIDKKIFQLKSQLAQEGTHQSKVAILLAQIEKQINEKIIFYKKVQKKIKFEQKKIVDLQTEISKLQVKLLTQQQALAKHVFIYYQMQDYTPLKILLSNNKIHKINLYLNYFRYIIKKRKSLITKVLDNKKKLQLLKANLEESLSKQKKLALQQKNDKKSLLLNKKQQAYVLKKLRSNIRSHKRQLIITRQNKRRLSRLLKQFSKTSDIVTQLPFVKRSLIYPVANARPVHAIIKPGVYFYSPEGSSVKAVRLGKVVFSNWLKGYGLLLIIDHGQGYMTLYAHNQALFKKRGDFVKTKEVIAQVGHTGGLNKNGLYFEVRYHGKVVPTLKWFIK